MMSARPVPIGTSAMSSSGSAGANMMPVLRVGGPSKSCRQRGLWRQMACGSYGPVRGIVTAHDMDPVLVQKITQAFVAVDARDPAGKAVLEGEACKAFVPGITTGWETLEKAAEQASIL